MPIIRFHAQIYDESYIIIFLYWRIIKRKKSCTLFSRKSCVGIFFRASRRLQKSSRCSTPPFVLQLLEMRVSLDRPDELSLSISNCPLIVWGRHLCYTMDCTFSQLQQDFDERQSVGNDPRLVRRHWVALILRDRVILWDVRCARGNDMHVTKQSPFWTTCSPIKHQLLTHPLKYLSNSHSPGCNAFRMCGRVSINATSR